MSVRECLVCALPDEQRRSIDTYLAAGKSIMVGADLILRGAVSYAELRVHRDEHISTLKFEYAADEGKLLRVLNDLMGLSLNQLSEALANKEAKPPLVLACIREARQTVETIARITGLDKKTDPRWEEKTQALIQRIAETLSPFPDARRAVFRMLEGPADGETQQ